MYNRFQKWLDSFTGARGQSSRRPFQLFQIEPTLQCGLECVMCPWSEIRATAGAMTWDTFLNIAENFPLAQSVDLTGGGEPTLSPHLPEMVRLAKQAGCSVGFSTNAVRLSPELSRTLIDLGLDWISFSVDAASAELYERIRQGASFDTVVANIRAFQELSHSNQTNHPHMMMVFVMMGGTDSQACANYHQLPDFIELAHSFGVEQVIAKNLDVILKSEDDQRRLFSHAGATKDSIEDALTQAQARAKALGVNLRTYALQPHEQAICEHDPLHNLFFNWEGYLSPCITLSYAEERIFNGKHVSAPCQRFGNINRETLQEIWKKPAYQIFRRKYEERLSSVRQGMLDIMLDHANEVREQGLPPAPEGCQTCYYLYGV